MAVALLLMCCFVGIDFSLLLLVICAVELLLICVCSAVAFACDHLLCFAVHCACAVGIYFYVDLLCMCVPYAVCVYDCDRCCWFGCELLCIDWCAAF